MLSEPIFITVRLREKIALAEGMKCCHKIAGKNLKNADKINTTKKSPCLVLYLAERVTKHTSAGEKCTANVSLLAGQLQDIKGHLNVPANIT